MPSRASCAAAGCTNVKHACKWGLFLNGEGKYERKRLCGTDVRGGCKNTSEVCKAVSFHRLPASKQLRKEWDRKLGRKNLPWTSNTYVCSVHFDDEVLGAVRGNKRGRPWIPTKFIWSNPPAKLRETQTSVRAREPHLLDERLLQSSSVCHDESDKSGSCEDGSRELSPESVIPVESSRGDGLMLHQDYPDDLTARKLRLLEEQVDFLQQQYLMARKDFVAAKSYATALEYDLAAALEENEQLKEAVAACKLSYQRLKNLPRLMEFYTGLDPSSFTFLLSVVGDSKSEACRHTVLHTEKFDGHDGRGRKRILKPEDELLLTLCKLRHNFPEEDLGVRFGVHQTTVSRIFSCWLEILDVSLDEISLWPSKEETQELMPDQFRKKFPNTRVIIDAAEVEIDQPKNPDTQSETWSQYKSRNTVKFLLAVTPNGVPCFVSNCYGGRISDKELTRRCGLLGETQGGKKRFTSGDAIMADKGFDIADLLREHGIGLNHPPFLRGKKQFSEEELVTTRRIASLRIHVERAIERIKNYQICQHFPANVCTQASRIIRVCTYLTALMPPLLPPAGE